MPRPFSTVNLSRRGLLLGTAIGAAGMLVGCGSGGGSRSSGAGNVPTGWTWPETLPFDGPVPDLPPVPDGVNAGFLGYPDIDSLVRTVTEKPGDGSPVTAMTPNYGPVPLDKNRNAYWQFINAELGSDLDVRMVPGSEYASVFATTVASGDVPDIFTLEVTPRQPEFLASQAVDLTDHLAGDAIAAYPNLAGNPEAAWRYSVFNGRVYTIPIYRGLRTSWALIQRSDFMAENGYQQPTSFEELLDIAVDFTNPSQNRWAFSDIPADFLRQCMGIPNQWGVDGDEITCAWADERQAELFEAGRRLMDAGVVHPEAFDDSGRKKRLTDGNALFAQDGLGGWNAFYATISAYYPELADSFDIDGTRVFDFAAGHVGQPWRGPDVEVQGVIGKRAESRVETVLAVANWLAAPVGSIEKHYQDFGVEGEHHTMEDGVPIKTQAGIDQWLNLQLMVSAPFTVFDPKHPRATERLHAFQTYLAEASLRSAADGLYSETFVADGGAAELTFQDLTNDIVQGRRSADDWQREVDDFMLATGDAIVDELKRARDETANA